MPCKCVKIYKVIVNYDWLMLTGLLIHLCDIKLLFQGPEGDKVIEMALKNPKKFVVKTQREATGM